MLDAGGHAPHVWQHAARGLAAMGIPARRSSSAPVQRVSRASDGYRGRLAPSPTGLLHLGHARTFWTAYERARDAGGVLVFRNEDLDPQRSRAEFVAAMFDDLRWL